MPGLPGQEHAMSRPVLRGGGVLGLHDIQLDV